MEVDGLYRILSGRGGQAGEFGVAVTVISELRREILDAFAIQDEVVRSFGGTQILCIDCSIGIEYFTETQRHVSSRGTLDANPLRAGDVLAKVIDINAGFGLGYGFGGEFAIDANGLEVLREDLDRRGYSPSSPASIPKRELRRIPAGLSLTRILRLAVVNRGVTNHGAAGRQFRSVATHCTLPSARSMRSSRHQAGGATP